MIGLGLGLGMGVRHAGEPMTVVPLQIVGTRGEINALEGGAVTTSNQKQLGRSRNYIGTQDVSEFQVGMCGFFVDTATSGNFWQAYEQNASNSYTLRGSVEIGGTVVRLKWGGALETVVEPGSLLHLSDPLLPSQFGLEVFPAQTEMWIKLEREFVVGQKGMFYQSAHNNPAIAGETYMAGGLAAANLLDTPGVHPTGNGWNLQAHVWLPYAIVGKPVAPMFAAMTIGASIENGVNDGQGDGLNGAGGYMRRMLANVNGQKVARIHLAKSGETAKSYALNSAKRRHMLQYVHHVFSGHGGNDYSTGETLANTQARWLTIWGMLKDGNPNLKVSHFSLAPKTNAAAWTTLEAQTPRNGFETGGAWRDPGNAFLAAQAASNPDLDYFVDIAAAMSPPEAPDLWRVDLGTPTTDGTHPSPVIAQAMANEAMAHLQSMITAHEG